MWEMILQVKGPIMPVDQKRIVELALANLESEKSRTAAQLRAQLGGKKPASTATASSAKATAAPRAKIGGKFVRTAAQKAKTADAMKKLWAKVRKAGFTNIKDYQASLKKGFSTGHFLRKWLNESRAYARFLSA